MHNNKHLLTGKWIEAVPNFSEGREESVIQAICAEIERNPDAYLLHKDMGYDANRTVITFVGKLEQMEEICFNVIRRASQLIDMRQHTGTHPRQGAIDVFPLIAIGDTTTDEAIKLSYRLGERIGQQLDIPVYLYEHSSNNPQRKKLEQIRKGEYEGFKEKILQDEWKPDFGPQRYHEHSGNIILGARDFLLAYNINLKTKDVLMAKNIAAIIRESGSHGKPGKLKGVKAIGWWIETYGMCQVSTNITDFRRTSIFEVYDVIHAEAKEQGVELFGSELIGLIPEEALKNDQFSPEQAIKYLGLDALRPFNAIERILEWNILRKIKKAR